MKSEYNWSILLTNINKKVEFWAWICDHVFDIFQRPAEWEETDRRCQLDATGGPHKLGYTRSTHGKNNMDSATITSQFTQKEFLFLQAEFAAVPIVSYW